MQRSTRQRAAIRHAVEMAGRPLLAHEVLEAARTDVPSLGLATVYRNLKALADARELQVVVLPGESPRYERMDHTHHHYFQCTSCHRVFAVHACPGDLAHLAPDGFELDSHEITLYGRCADCVHV